MTGVCVGPGFVVNGDGSLGLNGPRSGTWPYSGSGCTITAANGLRLDTTAGLWVEPPDLRAPFSFPGSNSTSLSLNTTAQSLNLTSSSVANADPCRTAFAMGAATATFSVSVLAGHTATIIGGAWLGASPSPTGQPTVWKTQNNGGVTAAYTATLTFPFQFSLAAGASGLVGPALWASADASAGASLNGISWQTVGMVMTSRTSW